MRVEATLLSNQSLYSLTGKAGKQSTLKNNLAINSLASIERTVINHELAHMSPGSPHKSTANYEYIKGPDGSSFIVSGGVSIDMEASGSSDKVIEKMQDIKKAALSPANPSFQDFVIAGKAIAIENYEKTKKIMDDYLSTSVKDSPALSVYM